MYITIDPYYSNTFYNESLEALKNNGVEYKEFISVKTPFDWYIQLDKEPIMVNYDKLPEKDVRWLVNKVQPLRPNEEYLLYRREQDEGPKALLKYIENEALKEARTSNYAVFFTIKNREEGEQITKDFPGKIWYFGKYYKNKFRVCLSTNEMIKNYINRDQILLEKGDIKEPGRFEADFNWRVLRGQDMLLKFTEMPFFKDGQYNRVKISPEVSARFNL